MIISNANPAFRRLHCSRRLPAEEAPRTREPATEPDTDVFSLEDWDFGPGGLCEPTGAGCVAG